MKNWDSLKITNILLLILIIEIGIISSGNMGSYKRNPHDDLSKMGAMPSETSAPMMNPHAHEEMGSAPAPQSGGFNFQNMVFAALRCPSDGTVSLADISCKGKDAEERRKFVSGLSDQNLPPRMMFDKIIEKFGEKALTDEALEIRANNRK